MFILSRQTRPLANVARAILSLPILHPSMRQNLARNLFRPQRQVAYEFVVPFHGLKYRGVANDLFDWHIFFIGTYEAAVGLVFVTVCERLDNPVFLDIGANKGMYSLMLAKYCQQVHAFEPFPEIASICRSKLVENAITNVTVHEVGLGAADADLEYYPPATVNQATGSFAKDPAEEGVNMTTPVILPVRRGDDYLRGIGIERFDVAKIDVEGWEPHVLEGLRESIETHRPFIVFEFSEASRAACPDPMAFRALFPESYELFLIMGRIGERKARPRCLRPTTFEEMFASGYANYLAVDNGKMASVSDMMSTEG